MAVVTEQMISQGDLSIVVYIHDDNGQGYTTGRLPCELDGTSIPERKTDTSEPEITQGFFTQGWSKFGGVEKCNNRSAMGLCKKEYLRIVVRGHDDSGQDIASGHLPFHIDGTSKFDSAEGSCVLATGLSISSQGFAKCWSKFGGMELCKTRSAMAMNKQDAWKIRVLFVLGSSAVAEFATEVFWKLAVRGMSQFPATKMGRWPLDRSLLPSTIWPTICLISARCCPSKLHTL